MIFDLLERESPPSTLKTIITLGDVTEEQVSRAASFNLKLYTFDKLLELGSGDKLVELPEVDIDTVLTFCYTSGTTGDPKGAIITQGNILSMLASGDAAIPKITFEDVHISYLPIPHIYERVFTWIFTLRGASIGFFNGNIKKLKFDLIDLKPTCMISVPRLFNKFYDIMLGSNSRFASSFLTQPRNLQDRGYQEGPREPRYRLEDGQTEERRSHKLDIRSPGVQQDEGGLRRAL